MRGFLMGRSLRRYYGSNDDAGAAPQWVWTSPRTAVVVGRVVGAVCDLVILGEPGTQIDQPATLAAERPVGDPRSISPTPARRAGDCHGHSGQLRENWRQKTQQVSRKGTSSGQGAGRPWIRGA